MGQRKLLGHHADDSLIERVGSEPAPDVEPDDQPQGRVQSPPPPARSSRARMPTSWPCAATPSKTLRQSTTWPPCSSVAHGCRWPNRRRKRHLMGARPSSSRQRASGVAPCASATRQLRCVCYLVRATNRLAERFLSARGDRRRRRRDAVRGQPGSDRGCRAAVHRRSTDPRGAYQVAEWRRTHPGEPVADGQVFVQPWVMGTQADPRRRTSFHQYRADRARRTLKGIDQQIAKAESPGRRR